MMIKFSFKSLLKEPLLHFLIIGLVLVGGERIVNSDIYANSAYKILVDDKVLSQFLQQQAKTFKPEQAKKTLAAMSKGDRELLIDDYVRGEVLYREALILNLDRNDPIIRRRLIQKMDYLSQGFYEEIVPLTAEQITAFYQRNKEDYRRPASATFTHIFVSKETLSSRDSKSIAETLMIEVNRSRVPFENAGRYGQRFLYNRNYVNRDSQEIASHFGSEFNQNLFLLKPVESVARNPWQGPLESNYGWHLVFLTKSNESIVPPLTDVGGVVLADAQREQQYKIKRLAIEKLLKKYKTNIRAEVN
jgi:parvulin-like peptidyl-prolyl isomerase